MEGVRYYANEPHLLGKAFLRLERDFDKHVSYCSNEPQAQAILETCDQTREFFEVGCDMAIKHLKNEKVAFFQEEHFYSGLENRRCVIYFGKINFKDKCQHSKLK